MPEYILPVTAPSLEDLAGLKPEQGNMNPPGPIDVSVPEPTPDKGLTAGWGQSNDLLTQMATTPTEAARTAPRFFDWDKTGAQRYADSPHYKELGFDPNIGIANENKYAQAQSGWEETKRGIGGAIAGLGHGFKDQLSSWSNFTSIFKDPTLREAYQKDQLEEINRKNREFDDNWHIFQGQDPTYYSTIMKGIQGNGHLIGAIGELAAETFLTNALITATFGAATPLEAVEAAKWAKLGEDALSTEQVIANSAKVADAMTPPSLISKLWTNIGNTAANASKYMPAVGNSLGYTGELMAYGAEGGAVATIGRGVGALTQDIRGINLATSFASGNAAGTYQQMVDDQTAQYRKQNGGKDPSAGDIAEIEDRALEAAKTDGALNAWAMLMMEKASFGNILNSRATIQQTAERMGTATAERIGIKPSWVKGAAEEPLYVKTQAKWYDMKANYWANGKGVLSHGVSFGATMNVMEGIDKGVKSYFDAKYDNKDVSIYDAIRTGVKSQFSKEGAGTFISGFLNGALLMGLGGAAFNAAGKKIGEKVSGINKSIDRIGETAEANARATEFVNKVNTIWTDPLNPIKGTLHDMIIQNSLTDAASNSLASDNRKDYHDIKDDATREFLMKMIKNGISDIWVNRVVDYSRNLNQDELCKMMGVDSTPENYQSLIGEIRDLPGRLKDLKRIKREMDNKMPNPFNPYVKGEDGKRLFPDGSKGFSLAWNNRMIYDIAKDYTIMMKDSAERATIRQNEILNGKNGTTGIVGMPFTKNLDFSTLFSATSVELLEKDMKGYQQVLGIDPNDVNAKKSLEATAKYKESLQNYLSEYGTILDKGAYPERKEDLKKLDEKYKEDLTKGLHQYIENSLTTRNLKGKVTDAKQPPSLGEVRDGIDRMMDYYKLGVDEGRATHMLNVVTDPSLIIKYQNLFLDEGIKRQHEAERERKEKEAAKETYEKTQAEAEGEEVPPTEEPPVEGVKEEPVTSEGPIVPDMSSKILAAHGLKMENRAPDGKVLGGQAGWKARINIKAVDDTGYKVNAQKIINWLNGYFGTTSPNEYAETGYYGFRAGHKTSIWKHLSGGDKGEADFTIYIGSEADLEKFASDVEKSPLKDIIQPSTVISNTKSTGDIQITNNITARFDPIDGKASFNYLAVHGNTLVNFLDRNGMGNLVDKRFTVDGNEYSLSKEGIVKWEPGTNKGVILQASEEDKADLVRARDYLLKAIYGQYYDRSVKPEEKKKEEVVTPVPVQTKAAEKAKQEANATGTAEESVEGEAPYVKPEPVKEEYEEAHIVDEEVPTTPEPEQKEKPVEKTPTPEQTANNKAQEQVWEEDRAAILKHYIQEGKTNPNMAIDLHDRLEAKLQYIDGIYKDATPEEIKQAKEDAINDYFDKLLNKVVEKKGHDNIEGNPHVIERTKDSYGISVNGKELPDTIYDSVRAANKALDKLIDEKHPQILDTPFRVGQLVHGDNKIYRIMQKGDKLSLREHIGREKGIDKYIIGKDIPVTKEELATNYYATTEEMPVPEEPVRGETKFDDSQPKSSDPYATVNIAPNNRNKETMTTNVLSIPHEDLKNGSGFTVTVQRNANVADDKNPIPGNTQIVQKGQDYSIKLSHNGVTIGYVTNPSPQVYQAPDGTNKTTQQLTLSDVAALYQPTRELPTSEMWLTWLQAQDENGQRLQELIDEAIKRGGVLNVQDNLQIVPHYSYDWIEAGETGPAMKDLQNVYRSANGEMKYVTINNEDGAIRQAVGVTDEEEQKVKGMVPSGQQSMYTSWIWLKNGNIVPVQLTPRQIAPVELNTLIENISNVDTTEKLEKAKKELNKLFIALPVRGKDQAQNKGISITVHSVGVGEENHLYVKVAMSMKDKRVELGSGNIYPGKGQTLNIADTQELLTKINQIVQSDAVKATIPEITESMLKWQPNDANVEDMEASVNPNIVKSISLTYSVPDTKGAKRKFADTPSIPQDVYDNAPEGFRNEWTEETMEGAAKVHEEEQLAKKEIVADSPKEIAKRKKEEQQRLKAEKAAKKSVPKRVEQGYSQQDIVDLNEFKKEVADKLPSFISVGDLDPIVENMANGNVTVGQMAIYMDELGNVAGRIETKAKNPYKYHEAYHAVHRLLLTPEQQQRLYDQANEENPVTQKKLDKFRASNDRYANMGEEELRNEYQEEYMADEFDKYSLDRKKSRAGSTIRAWFNRLWEWIRYIGDLLKGNRMRALFYKIHAGDYKNARLQENQFTDINEFTISDPVPKSIKLGLQETEITLSDGTKKTVIIDKYLSREKAEQLISDITAVVILKVQQDKNTDVNKIIKETMAQYAATHDPDSQRIDDIYNSIKNPQAKAEWIDRVTDVYDALTEDEPKQILIDNIKESLRIQGIKQDLMDEDDEPDQTSAQFYKKKSEIGGYGILDKDLRTYIGSTSMNLLDTGMRDDLGFNTHADGTPVYQAVDSNVVYNGLLKKLSGTTSIQNAMDTILEHRDQGNDKEVITFINRWLTESGFNEQEYKQSGELECSTVEGANILNKVLSGFRQMYSDYTSVIMDPETNKVIVTAAGRDSAEKNQYREWSNGFYENYWKQIEAVKNNTDRNAIYKQAVEPLEILAKQTNTIAAQRRPITDEQLSVLSKQISQDTQANLGVYLHPNYIAYSIVAGKEEGARTENQQKMMFLYPKAKAIDVKDMQKLFLPVLKGYDNPFLRPEGTTTTTPAEGWLLKTAKSNAWFDSNVNTMNHTNSEGNSVYDYQYASYNSITTERLNDPQYIEELRNNPDTNTWILQDPLFNDMQKSLMWAGGMTMKRTEYDVEEGERVVANGEQNKTGIDFSKFTPRDYAIFNLSVYDISTNPEAYRKLPDGTQYIVTPVSLGPIAEKSTNHSMYLPVRVAVESKNGKVVPTDVVREILYNEIKTICDRITRVKGEIDKGKNAIIDEGGKWIDGYHDGAQRGLTLYPMDNLIDSELVETLQREAQLPGFNIEDYKEQIHRAIDKGLMDGVKGYKEVLVNHEVITADGKNILAPEYLFKGIGKERNDAVNLKYGNLDWNLAQVYTNNYVNYVMGSRLLYGDKAKSSKNVADWWKRMGGNNGQGTSVASEVRSEDMAPMDNIQVITYKSDKFTTIHGTEGESDDGQALLTTKGYGQFLLGQGKLNELKKSLLDKAAQGKEPDVKEFKQMLKNGDVLNSLKPVYKDRETFLKCSVALLNRVDTSHKVDGKWVALPGREILHDKLNAAEQQEDGYNEQTGEYNENVVFIGNKTVSKGQTANIVPDNIGQDELDKYHVSVAADMMRLQTATPMTKHRGNKSTQPDKQILAGHDVSKEVYVNGEWKKSGDVIKQYMDANHQRVINNAIEAIGEMFSPITSLSEVDSVTFDAGKFMDSTIDTLMATGADSQTLEFFTTEDGVAQYNINLPSIVDKSTNIFIGRMIKGVTKEKVPMWKMTLRSDSGMSVIRHVHTLTADGQPKTWTIVSMDEYKKNPQKYASVHQYPLVDDKYENLVTDVYVADRLRDVIPQYDKDGKKVLYYYTEGMRPYMTVDEKEKGMFADSLRDSFGARTPGTGFQSYRRVKWVDRISDTLGNTAIVSRDTMTSTGHDYDVDSLFTAIYDTYIDSNGDRVLYGTATTDTGRFNEYLLYQSEHNRAFKNALKSNEIETEEEAVATLLGTYKESDRIKDVLKSLKMPSTPQEYKKAVEERGELNNGVLTNQALSAQLALLSGEHVSGGGKEALINRPTSTEDTELYAKGLATELMTPLEGKEKPSKWAQDVAGKLSGKTGDMNSMLGQLNAYEVLQQGGEGIGGVANILQTTSVLDQFRVSLRDKIIPYTFDGKVYNEYYGKKGNTPIRDRNQSADIIAQMHVDATKNGLPSKFMISTEYATLLTHMVKLGQTLENALLYPLTYPWQEYAKRALYSSSKFRKGPSQNSDAILQEMRQALIDRKAEPATLNKDVIMNYIKEGKRDYNVELALLNDLNTMRILTDPLKKMSRFMRFDTGRLLSNWDDIEHVQNGLNDLGVGMENEQFEKTDIPVDVRSIITKRHGNMSANYKVMKAINVLGKKAFIAKSHVFHNIENDILSNLQVPEWDSRFTKDLKQDILSYLSLTAYMKWLGDNKMQEVLDSMNQNLIWDNEQSNKSIISIMQNLRGQLKGKDKNYALNQFLNTVLKDQYNNINQVIANTWTKMSEQQQSKVVGSIVDIVANKKGDIHKGGLALFNYLLVKDGGQYKNNSFIKFIPAFMMKDWSDSMTRIVDVLQKPKVQSDDYIKLFGKDYYDMVADIRDAYMTHKDNLKYVPDIKNVDSAAPPRYAKSGDKLAKLDANNQYQPVSTDGDSKQWKGAKAVFGEYPVQTKQSKGTIQTTREEAQQVKEQKSQQQANMFNQAPITDVTKELLQNHGIVTGYINGKGVFIKGEAIYPVTPGTTPRQLLQQLRGESIETPQPVMESAQPVVPSQGMNTIPLTTNFSRASVANDPEYIYLFTDNAARSSGGNQIDPNSWYVKKYGQGRYPGMTQAVIRGLNNAYPITTMVDDKRTQWNDTQFAQYKAIIDSEVADIKNAISVGQFKGVKFAAQMPFGKGQISNMRESAPKIWQYMNGKLREIGIDNSGNIPTSVPSQSMEPVAYIPQNKVSGVKSYGSTTEANDNVKKVLGPNPHSIDMIAAGLRTRTTRSADEMKKYNVKVGDIVKHFGKSADGTTKIVYTRVTAIHPKGSPGWKGTWAKEGWREEDNKVIDRFKDGAAAIEFEAVDINRQQTPSQTMEPVQQNIESIREQAVKDVKELVNANGEGSGSYGIAGIVDKRYKNPKGEYVTIASNFSSRTFKERVQNGEFDDQLQEKYGQQKGISQPVQQVELKSIQTIGDMFTRDELNNLYKNRNNKSITAIQFKDIVNEYLNVPWHTSKEEITEALKCL
jgi:hypothetical protein